MRRRRILSLVVFTAMLGSTAACAKPRPVSTAPDAADLSALVLRRLDGTQVKLEAFRGKVVLLDVWATWCEPCRYSLPFYRELYGSLNKRGLEVLAVSVDESDEAVRAFLRREALPFPVFRDPRGEAPRVLGATAMPMSFLLDREGTIRWRHAGFQRGDESVVRKQVLAVLDEKRELPSAERPVMGTRFRVTIDTDDVQAASAALEACFRLFEDVDRAMSEWKPESPLSEVNRQAGVQPVRVPDDLFAVLETARETSARSEGAFDVTWAALWGLWKFDGTNRVPSAEEINQRLGLVGWRDLVLDPAARTAFLRRKGMAIGLGGIAKGYALRLAADDLRRRGFENFLLYAGGQVYAAGRKKSGAWQSGIQDPRGEPGDFFAAIEVENASLSTSGDYEHAFVKDGVRYHHIIDLRTGYPARGVRSATVLASDPTLADAYSTVAVVLGVTKALALAKASDFELLLVDDEGQVHMTDGLKTRLKIVHPPSHPAE